MKISDMSLGNMSKEIYLKHWNTEINEIKRTNTMSDVSIEMMIYNFLNEVLQSKQSFDTLNENTNRELLRLSRNDLCFCGSNIKAKNCHNGISEESYIADLLKKINYVDGEIDILIKKHDKKIICEFGCNECCKDYFYISKFEYFIIKNYILTTMGLGKLNEYILKANKQADELKTSCFEEYDKIFNKKVCDFELESHIYSTNIKKFHMCIFNNADTGNCDVYQSRPYICRMYGIDCISVCSKVKKKCSNIFGKSKRKMEKHLLNLRNYIKYIRVDNDIFYVEKYNQYISVRCMPMIYWFCNDEYYNYDYKDCIKMNKADYFKKYII